MTLSGQPCNRPRPTRQGPPIEQVPKRGEPQLPGVEAPQGTEHSVWHSQFSRNSEAVTPAYPVETL